jgi:hypothetical protein
MSDFNKFEYLWTLPDPLLIKGIELLFLHHQMDANLDRLKTIRKSHKYLLSKNNIHDDPYSMTIDYYVPKSNDFYPSVTIRSTIGGSLHMKYFNDKGLYIDELFDDYYNICFALNRKETLNHILE